MATGIKIHSNITNKHVKEILDAIIGLRSEVDSVKKDVEDSKVN